MPQLSVIIPAYNEETRLPPTLASVHAYLSSRPTSFEIVVVDDGSTDHTVDVVQEFAMHHDCVRLISYTPNQGKGHAVRTGMLSGHGDYLLLNDADGSSPIEEIERLENAARSGAQIVLGSRNKPGAETKIEALSYRKHIGNTFNLMVRSLLLPGVYDTQCGFKLFEQEVAQDVFSVARQNGFAFDVEVLFIARLRGYKIEEVGINWHNVEGSKVNVFTDSANMLLEILRIKCGAWFGQYRRLKMFTAPMQLPKQQLPPKE